MVCRKCKNRYLRREFAAVSCLICGWICYYFNVTSYELYLQDKAFKEVKTYFTLIESAWIL